MKELGTLEKLSAYEDELLRELFIAFNNNFIQIARYLPERTRTAVKDRFEELQPENSTPKPFFPEEDAFVQEITTISADSQVQRAAQLTNRLPISIWRRYAELHNVRQLKEPLESNRLRFNPTVQTSEEEQEPSKQNAASVPISADVVIDFTSIENAHIKNAVGAGNNDIRMIQKYMPHQSISRIREQMKLYSTKPKDPRYWLIQEYEIIREFFLIHGNGWTRISQNIPGRNPTDVQHRFMKLKNLAPKPFKPLEHAIVTSIRKI